MQSDFNTITKAEFRAYVIQHPNGTDGLYAFVDRFTADAPAELYSVPRSRDEIKEVEKLI